MAKVMKRDGAIEDYIHEKIIVSCIKAGAPVSVAREIAAFIGEKIKVETSTAEIKRFVLWMLRQKNPEWENNWLKYEETVKKKKM